MGHLVERGYLLGIVIAEHAHGVRRRFRDGTAERMLDALEAVANGDLSLIDTPEEVIADTEPPPSVAARMHELLRSSRDAQREAAQLVLKSMFGDSGTGS